MVITPTAAQRDMFANRLLKNAKHRRKWARRAGVSCYRVYERDIPEVPLIVDDYEGFLHIALFDPRDELGEQWAQAMAGVAGEALAVSPEDVFLKWRRRLLGNTQYSKVSREGLRLQAHEGGHHFWVNLTDYVDTGLFLDHRQTRAMVEAESRGKRVLNLFSYTGAFSVYAAAGGASHTVSVDLSNTYSQWAVDNLRLNGFTSATHDVVTADVMSFLRDYRGPKFDLAVVDPPTFSNSKKTDTVWDVHRDHADLLQLVRKVMREGGTAFFSANARKFRLSPELEGWVAEDITANTVPPDFARRPPHKCYRLTATTRS